MRRLQKFVRCRRKKRQAQRRIEELRQIQDVQPHIRNTRRTGFLRFCGGLTAAAAAFSGVCIVNPAFAAQIPLVGHVFEQIGDSLGFSGDFSGYAEPLQEAETEKTAEDSGENGSNPAEEIQYSQTKDGVTLSLSEVYCNDEALYVSLVMKSEEKLPETEVNVNQNDNPIISLNSSRIKFSYDDNELCLLNPYLDGKLLDEYTYAGVLRYEFEGEAAAPDKFDVTLSVPQVVGMKADAKMPEMPEDIRAEYENAMAENGLSTEESAYESFTEEQKNIEHELYTAMWNAYGELFPEINEYPNKYTEWWVDGLGIYL